MKPVTSLLIGLSNTTVRLLVHRHLENAGYDVDCCTSGREVVEKWQDNHYDCILADESLPDMPALEAFAIIREQSSATGRKTPLILITSGESAVPLDPVPDAILTKPISKEDLLASVSRCLGTAPAPTSPIPKRIHPELIHEEIGDNPALFHRLIIAAHEELQHLLFEAEEALARQDAPALRIAVHTMKTTFRHWGAQEAHDAALSTEKSAAEAQLQHAATYFPLLQAETHLVCSDLTALG